MAGIDFQAVRNAIPIARVLVRLCWRERTRVRNEARGPCPIHGASSPRSRSFAVDLGTDRWYCHSCKVGGDVIDLWALVHTLNTWEAVHSLCEVFNVPIPYLQRAIPGWEGTEKRNGNGRRWGPSSMF